MRLIAALFLLFSFSAAAQVNCPDSGGNHLNYLTATHKWLCGTSGSAVALSGITAATGANSINNGDNAQVWNWSLTTAAKSAFLITENVASTNGVSSQYLLDVKTITNSTALPFRVAARGSIDNIRVSRLGSITIAGTGGTAGGGTSGSAITITAGQGAATAAGGAITLHGGDGGATSGNAGSIDLTGGTPTDGNGTTITITATDGVGTNRNGGSTRISAGTATGNGTNGNIDFRIPSDNPILRVNGLTQHYNVMGTAPAITANCGTTPSLVGKDQAMLVTVGAGGTATNCTVTFANAFTNAPICVAQSDTDLVGLQMVTTTTTVSVSKTTAFTAGSKLHILCMGYE